VTAWGAVSTAAMMASMTGPGPRLI
jgi:hypothetical protein